jgi:hypothetical protein
MARGKTDALMSMGYPRAAALDRGGLEKDSIMDDIKQRDLGQIPEDELTDEERAELKRRFDEFVGRLRQNGGLEAIDSQKASQVQRWDPRRHSRKR